MDEERQKILQKEKEYRKYVDEHIANVQKAWEQMKQNRDVVAIFDDLNEYTGRLMVITLDNLIPGHDRSKYGLDEFNGYRCHFYPVDEYEKIDNLAAYDRAWEHHKRHNFHHWDSWSDIKLEDSMPLPFVVEMCCDWIAMSMKFGGDAYHWYKDQKDIILGKRQRELAEKILKTFYNIKE